MKSRKSSNEHELHGFARIYSFLNTNYHEFTRIIMERVELFNDHFQNFKVYGIPHAQLIIADPPYNLGKNAYASNPVWYYGGDNKNGESELAGKEFFEITKFRVYLT